jgi:hypothetical protein
VSEADADLSEASDVNKSVTFPEIFCNWLANVVAPTKNEVPLAVTLPLIVSSVKIAIEQPKP